MKRSKITLAISFLCLIIFSTSITAQTWLPSFFSDNMVLQQNDEVNIWGKDDAKTKIIIKGSWGEEATAVAGKEGEWKLKLKTPKAGGPYTLEVLGSEKITLSNVFIGEVWLCSGQSNMAMTMYGYFNQPINGSQDAILESGKEQISMFTTERNSSLKPLDDVTGKWEMASPSTTGGFSATAYFFAKKLHSILNVPIGIIHTSWGGTRIENWMDKEALYKIREFEIPESIPEDEPVKGNTLLYNAMIAPFVGYTIKGALWYQGEANRSQPSEYKQLLPGMIQSWREHWQQGDFPFYFVQIAPYCYDGVNSAFLREAQLQAMLSTPNTGMAVTVDIGECPCIHPAEKKKVGDRLAYWALINDYMVEGIACNGPIYKSMKQTSDGKIELTFDFAPRGMTTYGKELEGFEIAGENKEFFLAKATINRNKTITVWAEPVKEPVAVRYAFKNWVVGTLYNVEGLPASSFRTDDWEE